MTLNLWTDRVHQDYNPSQTSTTPYTPPKNEEEAQARIQQARTSSTAATSLRVKAADHLNKALKAHDGSEICKEEIKKAVDEKAQLIDQRAIAAEKLAKIEAFMARKNLLAAKNT